MIASDRLVKLELDPEHQPSVLPCVIELKKVSKNRRLRFVACAACQEEAAVVNHTDSRRRERLACGFRSLLYFLNFSHFFAHSLFFHVFFHLN